MRLIFSAPGSANGVSLLALVVCLLSASQLPGADPVAVPLELQPYRVRVDVSFAARPEFPTDFRLAVLSDLRDGLDRSAGALWQFVVAEDQNLRPAGVEPLRRVPAEHVTSQAGDDFDKLFLLSVEPTGGGYLIAGREWDALTRELGPVQTQTFPERREISASLVGLLRALFRPVAVVTQARGGPVLLRSRGGALAPHDDTWQPLREGSLFEVYFRSFNKDQVVDRIQPIPWTYLTVGRVELGMGECVVTSGVRASFRPRRRLETVALEAVRQVPATRLTLETRPPLRRPLGGVEVELQPQADSPESGRSVSSSDDRKSFVAVLNTPVVVLIPRAAVVRTTERLVTDRNGQVILAAPQSPVKPVWLSVRSGQNLLARVPFVPGLRAEERMELPDDTPRLEVEGQVAQLQSELVDTVARRAVVLAQTKIRAKAREWTTVDELLKQLASMPGAAAFTADLSAVRLNARQAARARKDKAMELRVERLCNETAGLIKEYLEDDKVKALREEVAELKQIAAEEAAAAEQFKADQEKAVRKPSRIDNPAKRIRPAPPPSGKPEF